jgi:hypothetical protein
VGWQPVSASVKYLVSTSVFLNCLCIPDVSKQYIMISKKLEKNTKGRDRKMRVRIFRCKITINLVQRGKKK